MYISWPLIVLMILGGIVAVSLCIHFACRSKRFKDVVSKLEGHGGGRVDPDDSDWGDAEGMS